MLTLKRKQELSVLEHVARSNKSEFLYVRGRRRIGKTWLLKTFQKKHVHNCFYYAGAKGARFTIKKTNFVNMWDRFTGEKKLSKYKASELDWPMILKEIGTYAAKKEKKIILIFDEIQWLASQGDSFAGDLKTAWADWQKDNLIKVIICGSSSKFFSEVAGGPDTILRGLHTRPHLWVDPITPQQMREQCFPKWKIEEVTMLYMMIGGVPYYLERIDPQKGFIHAVNDAFFISEGNLLDEIDELLNYDFSQAGIRTVKKILMALGQDGCSQSNIVLKTGLSQSSVHELIDKLLEYKIIFEKQSLGQKNKRNRSGTKYYMKDFFLNFYFQILRKCEVQIRNNNQNALIFPIETGLSLSGFFIPNFSGKAFELFARYLLEKTDVVSTELGKKLLLKELGYTVDDYWDSNTQIDLVIENKKDRLTRVIECKWQKYSQDMLSIVLSKKIKTKYDVKYYLFVPTMKTQTKNGNNVSETVAVLNLMDYYRS